MKFTRILRFVDNERRRRWGSPIQEMAEKVEIRDILHFFSKPRDFTLKGLQRRVHESTLQTYDEINKFSYQRYVKYGPELYSAYFACYVRGKARIENSNKWIKFDDKLKEKILPETYHNIKIEGLDFSYTLLNYTGLDNIEGCSNLRTLVLKSCAFVDDWCLSRISGTFSDTLETLDLTSNNNITDNGLLSLAKLKNLKSLNLTEVTKCKNIEYICSLLESQFPELVINGIDFRSDEAIDKVRKKLEAEQKEYDEALEKLDEKNKKFINFFKNRAEFIKQNNL